MSRENQGTRYLQLTTELGEAQASLARSMQFLERARAEVSAKPQSASARAGHHAAQATVGYKQSLIASLTILVAAEVGAE